MPTTHRAAFVVFLAAGLGGCAANTPQADPAPASPSMPIFMDDVPPPVKRATMKACDLSAPGAVCWGSTPAEVFDSARLANPIQLPEGGVFRRVKEILPPHQPPQPAGAGPPNALVAGEALDEGRASVQETWPAIGATGWNPPDPTLAVGPNHVVTTVNQQIAWYTRTGTVQVNIPLGSAGNPGFFEPVGGSTFVFDPKCFYDHLAQRFVVMAPEVYSNTQEAYLCIAVSDDSNPNGTWYKYRTDAVISVNGTTYWWDYPGFGYDAGAYYVTSNLFGLNAGGFGGTGFRVFNKTPMLTGQPATYATLRDGNAASVQVAQHFGTPIAPYFVATGSSTQIRVRAITNPLTNPAIVSSTVSVPSYSGPTDAPTPGGDISTVDSRIMNACWRNGKLLAAHTITSGGKNVARWYEINTNNWPTSGSCSLAQSGNVDPGPGLHGFFPAIYSNAAGEIGMVLGTSSAGQYPGVAVTGRRPADPNGRMGVPVLVKPGEAGASGRWGDYFDMAIDPVDDTTFWCIGEYARANGWSNWITSFLVSDDPLVHAVPDDAGAVSAGVTRTIDVMANDWHSTGLSFVIDSFTSSSIQGGSVTRSVGSGPGGRDQLVYVAPTGVNANDSFTYTLRDSAGNTATAAVSVFATDPATWRAPDSVGSLRTGVNVAYYELNGPSVLPNFNALRAYGFDDLVDVNLPSTDGVFATSERADNLGAVFTGYVRVTQGGYYMLSLTSDDGSKMFIGDDLLISNDGTHGMRTVSGAIGLLPGNHRVRIEFFEGGGGAGLVASIGPFNGAVVPIPGSQWWRDRCTPDMNQDGSVDQGDIACLIAAVAGDLACTTLNPDFNGDGSADQGDIQALIRVVAGSPCP